MRLEPQSTASADLSSAVTLSASSTPPEGQSEHSAEDWQVGCRLWGDVFAGSNGNQDVTTQLQALRQIHADLQQKVKSLTEENQVLKV